MTGVKEERGILVPPHRRQEVIDLIALIDISVTLIEGNKFHKEPIRKNTEKLLIQLGISYQEFSTARAEIS